MRRRAWRFGSHLDQRFQVRRRDTEQPRSRLSAILMQLRQAVMIFIRQQRQLFAAKERCYQRRYGRVEIEWRCHDGASRTLWQVVLQSMIKIIEHALILNHDALG